jgi:hypothetical protein
MFATLFGLSDTVIVILVLIFVLWVLRDLFQAANGPIARGIWYSLSR